MTEDARRRAEGCFALARRSSFPHEVATAVERGKRLCERHGLDLNDFDIPGRAQAPRRPPPDARLFDGGPFNGFEYVDIVLDSYALNAALAAMQEALNRQWSVKEEAVRRAAAKRDGMKRDALQFLWSRGVRIYYDSESGRYLAPEEGEGLDVDENEVLDLARRRGWNR